MIKKNLIIFLKFLLRLLKSLDNSTKVLSDSDKSCISLKISATVNSFEEEYTLTFKDAKGDENNILFSSNTNESNGDIKYDTILSSSKETTFTLTYQDNVSTTFNLDPVDFNQDNEITFKFGSGDEEIEIYFTKIDYVDCPAAQLGENLTIADINSLQSSDPKTISDVGIGQVVASSNDGKIIAVANCEWRQENANLPVYLKSTSTDTFGFTEENKPWGKRGFGNGLIQVFQLNNDNTWENLGDTFFGKQTYYRIPKYEYKLFTIPQWDGNFGELKGFSIAVSGDGKTIAITSPYYSKPKEEGGGGTPENPLIIDYYDKNEKTVDILLCGKLEVYTLNESNKWILKGNPIYGLELSTLGKVSISDDGNAVAVSLLYSAVGLPGIILAYDRDNNLPNYRDPQVIIYEYLENDWSMVGVPIYPEVTDNLEKTDYFGYSLSLIYNENVKRIAINNVSILTAVKTDTKGDTQKVLIYDLDGDGWKKILEYDQSQFNDTSLNMSNFGHSLNLSKDGKNLVVGNPSTFCYSRKFIEGENTPLIYAPVLFLYCLDEFENTEPDESKLKKPWAFVLRENDQSWNISGEPIKSETPQSGFGFATTISEDGNSIAISNLTEDNEDNGIVSIYDFVNDSWSKRLNITNDSNYVTPIYGTSIATTDKFDTLVVGSSITTDEDIESTEDSEKDLGNGSGLVTVFKI